MATKVTFADKQRLEKLYATEVNSIKDAINANADELTQATLTLASKLDADAVAQVLALAGKPLNELALPLMVRTGLWYVTATGIWEARKNFSASVAPVSGPNWRVIVGFASAFADLTGAPSDNAALATLLATYAKLTTNTFTGVQTFQEQLNLGSGAYIDKYGLGFLKKLSVDNQAAIQDGALTVNRTGQVNWKSGDYLNSGAVDLALRRAAAGQLALDTGTAGQYATLLLADVVASAAPDALNSLLKVATALRQVQGVVPASASQTNLLATQKDVVWTYVGDPANFNITASASVGTANTFVDGAYGQYNVYGAGVSSSSFYGPKACRFEGLCYNLNIGANAQSVQVVDSISVTTGAGTSSTRFTNCSNVTTGDNLAGAVLQNCTNVVVEYNCKNIELYNCGGTAIPFRVPAGTKNAVYRSNVLQVNGSSSATNYDDTSLRDQLETSRTTLAASATQTGSYTLAASDAGNLLPLDSASAITLLIPTDEALSVPVGCVVNVSQEGVGVVTVAGAGGVTVTGIGLKTPGQYGEVGLRKAAANTWRVIGGVA